MKGLWSWWWMVVVVAVVVWGCVEDQPREGTQAPARGGVLMIETVLTSCDLRHPSASCRSNDTCGVCDISGFPVWFWRAPSSECLWTFTDAGTTPNTEPLGWDVCEDYGPMDHRTSTP